MRLTRFLGTRSGALQGRAAPLAFGPGLAAAALLVLLGGCGGGAAPDGRTSALLITLDTTIPEALGCYGGRPEWTPHLDRLAAGGIVFTNARTVAPMTTPAHASILTGLYPLRHTVRLNGSMVLPEAADTLAERARAAGYQTAAIVAAVVLDGEFGVAQGFDVYDAPETPRRVEERLAERRSAADVVDRALRWLDERDEDRPFLLWLHFFDPHLPYDPPADVLARIGNPYQAEVSYMDRELGRFLDAFESEGLLERSVVAVVGDHGEGLGRHDEPSHMTFAFDSTLKVPFVLRFPGGRGAGTRSDAVVSVVDLYPTWLAALDLGDPGDVDGVDLLAGVPDGRGVYFETYLGWAAYGWSPLAGRADGASKYLHSSAPELYDVTADPGETQNRVAERPDDVERHRRAIAELAGRTRLEQSGLGEAFGGLRGQIEKLGYAGTGADALELPEPLATVDRPSPHQRTRAFADYLKAQGLTAETKSAEAIALLLPIVESNPRNHKAHFLLALNYMEEGRYAEAVPVLKQSIAHSGGERLGADVNLALCYEKLERWDDAIAQYEAALEVSIGPPGVAERLVALLERFGHTEKTQRYRERIRTER